MELAWGVGVVLLGIGCFGDGVGAGDDLLLEVGAWLFRWYFFQIFFIYSQLLRSTTARGSCTCLVTVGPTMTP